MRVFTVLVSIFRKRRANESCDQLKLIALGWISTVVQLLRSQARKFYPRK